MTVHRFPGLGPTPLASYLAGLGLVRVLGEQADPALTAWWAGDELTVDTTVTDPAGWLVERYVPTPVLSPWNEGSGFGAKDRTPRATLQALLDLPDPRLDAYREAMDAAARVGRAFRDSGWSKPQAVLAFRNTCPEAVLPWIDATVVLTDGDASFPPLLGTGGNDGRLDFSTNQHQRLLDVLAPGNRARSLRLAIDLLTGVQTEPMRPAAVGQFDPGSAGGKRSSPFGDAESLVNPWAFVLMIEGAMLFAAGVARRHAHAAGRAGIPFTVTASVEGAPGGATGETTRGEVWAPLWTRPFDLAEIRQLFAEARAAWQGRAAVRAVEFYQAAVAQGVARGVASFQRYGLHQRNGLAFVAVPLDRVEVRPLPAVRLAAAIESWVRRIPRLAPAAVRSAVRRFEAAQVTFAKTGTGEALVDLLAALTGLEQTVGRSGRLRDEVGVRMPPPARGFLAVLAASETPELRIAAGLASCAAGKAEHRRGRTMRQLLLPIDPGDRRGADRWRDGPIVPGYGVQPLRTVLAEVLAWRCRTAVDETEGSRRGVPGFGEGVQVPAADLHWWVEQHDDAPVERYFAALLALDWTGTDHRWTGSAPSVPVPTLVLLHALASGVSVDTSTVALDPDWAGLLRAGHVARVHNAASRRLRQAGWRTVDPPPRLRLDGRAIAAATVPRCRDATSMLHHVATPERKDSP